MKKRIAILGLTLIIIVTLFSGCDKVSMTTEDRSAVDTETSPFITISSDVVYGQNIGDDTRIFAYDKYTKVVYYLFSNFNYGFVEGDHTYTYFSQYVNENGKYCVYNPETNTISEIN